MGDSTFTFQIDDELKSAFAEVSRAQDRTAAQSLRVLMRDAVERWQELHGHDAWFRRQVEQAIGEADDPSVERTPHDQVRSSWRQQRAELERRGAGRTA